MVTFSASAPPITKVRQPRTRDLIRGLLTKHAEANTSGTFHHLMAQTDGVDLGTVDALLRNSPLFAHLQIRSEFPVAEPPFFDTEELLIVPQPHLRKQYVVQRANSQATLIAASLSSLDLLSQAIFIGYDSEVVDGFQLIISNFGHSLALARKLAFILGHYERDTESWRLASKTFASYGANARNFGMMAVADSIGTEFSYLAVKLSFDSFSDRSLRSSAGSKLSYLSFQPITFSADEALDGIAANYLFSLTDAVLYALVHRELGVLNSSFQFDTRIENVWSGLKSRKYAFELFFNDTNHHSDLRAFRAAPAFLEYQVFRTWRAAAQRLYDSPENRAGAVTDLSGYEIAFYSNVTSTRDLLPAQSEASDPLPVIFDRVTAGNLSRSCGLVRISDRDPDFASWTRDEIGSLMAQTTDVDRLLSTATLRTAAQTASDAFVKLILLTLLRAHTPSTKDNYQFKRSFQDYVRSSHGGQIMSFIESVYTLDAAIVAYYIELLDETMLSQLPFLIKAAEEVYEVRASLLEWYANQTGDLIARDKAKQLRIDRKIASVRGQINETRLNIDSVRFRQWIDASKLADFSGFIRQESFIMPVGVDVRVKKGLAELRLVAHRDPNARAAIAVMDCYREFCTNSDFGVASYLGRRIRHGTLRGTLLDGLPDPDTYELSAHSRAGYERWLGTFRASIDSILAKLHFAGKGGGGSAVISAEIDSKDKWDIVLNCLRTLHEKAQADFGAMTIPLIIEQYCWYMFELELHDVRNAVLESRIDFGIFKLKSASQDPAAPGFEKVVNIALGTRFATVASWFRKPPNISPVADLGDIVEVVLREAKAEYAEFNPRQTVSGVDLQLSGAVYYHVYDALAVIVRNAGKHGWCPGILSIVAEIEERDSGTVLRLDIRSRVRDGDSGGKAIARMREAEQAGVANADVVERLSGMRKLQKMKVDRTLLDVRLSSNPGDDRNLLVSAWFALTGLVE